MLAASPLSWFPKVYKGFGILNCYALQLGSMGGVKHNQLASSFPHRLLGLCEAVLGGLGPPKHWKTMCFLGFLQMQILGSLKFLMAVVGPSWPLLGPIVPQNGPQSGPKHVQKLVQQITLLRH